MNNSNTYSGENGQFDRLKVIDRLEINSSVVEKRRLKASYRVYLDGKVDETELIYHFEEDVFLEKDIHSQNLADIIAAQVSLNYGLFCREILFHGTFDETDKRFIKEMMENTAREIYVKKFLEPNPFLINEFKQMPAIKRKNYRQANVIFTEKVIEKTGDSEDWFQQGNKHAILSSGGKDSLLSFGLMQELNYDVHPIFINESGRHWFTALNAYRYFRRNISHTARIWTNADRLFNWMLKHLPFIRKDYSRIRSDEYPIRLWTVAVFLFGALPILKRRRIGYLLIGDEYDTTRKASYKGISHYDGLYDQSLYFDRNMTRFFMRKGWNIFQFSLLRSLSELLIEKILVQRYPELQKNQVSCHAAHVEGNSVKPCGKCEKCRRIVAMLKALDANPQFCGYTSIQITNCLRDLAGLGVHQETAGAQQLNFMLDQKGMVNFPKHVKKSLKDRPEILKIRVDPERSPANAIPPPIYQSLLRIFSEYAIGVARKEGKKWIDEALNIES
jgi:hypothetical protein